MKWECVNFETRVLMIKRGVLYSRRIGTYEGSTKSRKLRALKISPETMDLLIQQKKAQDELREANGDRWVETGYVFTRDNGEPMNPDSVTDWLGEFSNRHGLPHIHPHAFRHTSASTMIANGVDLVTAANELGHANATTTAKIYAHQIAEAKAAASEIRTTIFRHREIKKGGE